MSMVLFLIAAVTEGQAASRPVPVPDQNPATWFREDDYPGDLRTQAVGGIAVFTVTVGVNGRVKSCAIVATSGSAGLDKATCEILAVRASFQPATDAAGKPIEAEYSNSVRWEPPITFPFHSEQSTTVVMVQEKNGVISSCKLRGGQPQDNEEEVCKMMKSRFAWPAGHTYEPDRKQIVYTLKTIKDITVLPDDMAKK